MPVPFNDTVVPLKVTVLLNKVVPVMLTVRAAAPLKVTGALAVKFPVPAKFPLSVAEVADASTTNEAGEVTVSAPEAVNGINAVTDGLGAVELIVKLKNVVDGVPLVFFIAWAVLPPKTHVPLVQLIVPLFSKSPLIVELTLVATLSVPVTVILLKVLDPVPLIVVAPPKVVNVFEVKAFIAVDVTAKLPAIVPLVDASVKVLVLLTVSAATVKV